MEILGYISLFCVGLVLGTLGGGGSILSVPVLVYLFAVDAVMASAYSLFIVGTTSLVGTLLRYRAQRVDVRVGITFGLPSLAGIFCTRKWIVPALPDLIVQFGEWQLTRRLLILGVFAVLMMLASLVLLTRKERAVHENTSPSGISLMVAGLLTGFLTGLVGAGGGFLIVPALVYFAHADFRTAIGTTLLIITVNSLSGFLGDILNYSINWYFLLGITGLAVVGILVGTRIAWYLPVAGLRKLFGWFVMSMSLWILIRELSY